MRKTDAVTDRVTDIESYRLALLRILHSRYKNSDYALSDGRSKLPAAELESMQLFKSRFRIASVDEPPVLEISACYCGLVKSPNSKPAMSRWGLMYATERHLFFSASATVGAALTGGRILGLFGGWSSNTPSDSEDTGAEISLVFPIQTIISCKTEYSSSSVNATGNNSADSNSVFVTDTGGNTHLFEMASTSPHQSAPRICDLFTILQSCAASGFDLGTSTTKSGGGVAENGKEGFKDSASIVDRAFVSSNSHSDTKTAPTGNEENLGLLFSRTDAFSHVLKLASSAVGSAASVVRPASVSTASKNSSGDENSLIVTDLNNISIKKTNSGNNDLNYEFTIDTITEHGAESLIKKEINEPSLQVAVPSRSRDRESASLGKSIQVATA